MRPTYHLFTIRIWQEEVEDGIQQFRGRLQYGLRGEARTFHSWTALVEQMEELLNPSTVASDDSSQRNRPF